MMKINVYSIDVVCANYDGEIRGYGDIYDEVEECLKHHPEDEVIFGFHLKKEGVETPDWFDTVEEAVQWASND